MKPIDKVYKSQDALRRGITRLRNARAVIRESLADLIEQTLEHGSPAHLAQGSEFFPEIAHVHEEREKALAVLSAWRSVDVVEGYGEDVSWVDLPCRIEAAEAAERARRAIMRHRQLRHRRAAQERGKRRKAEAAADVAAARAARQEERRAESKKPKPQPKPQPKPTPKPKPKPKPKPVVISETASTTLVAYAPDAPIDGVSDLALVVMIKASKGARRDELWREAKRRGWSRRQMIESFE